FKQIKDLKTCLFFTSRALKPSEVAYLKSKRQLPEVFPIAYDGLALIVNSSNNDTCMTVKDVKRILSGEVTNWNQIVKGSKRGEIEVVFDNKESATLHYVVDSLLDGKPINSPNIVASKTSKEVVDYVDQTPNAIGVIGSNWLNDRRDTTNTTFKKNIHVMSISLTDEATPRNSWKPYQAYLLDGRYPFVRTIYAILVDPQRALPYSFANYVTNPKGQLIVFKSGLLPFRGDIIIKDVKVKK
ncbi:MAG: substrate-binding domain-containing protein, partial [Prevotella sp.]|nr:substrate-binding domain-containing protein [Prevotella sp.]